MQPLRKQERIIMAQNVQKRNYQLELEHILNSIDKDKPPRLLLQSCCAPCSSYVLEYLSNFFSITVFYFNPNIYPEEEFYKRSEEQKRLLSLMKFKYPVDFTEIGYQSERFYDAVKGLEHIKEGGERCHACYKLRLEQTAQLAKELDYDFFTTTLSISPYKNADWLNEIGEALAQEYGVRYLTSDFKKKNGYKRSTELSESFGMYRQNYCGCVFSMKEREEATKNNGRKE